jgi:ATP-grasp domain
MPYVLVAAAILWPNAVRLCRTFREVGFEVGAIALPQHPVHRSKAPDRTFDYRPKAALDSLRKAIAERRPDIIVPCDDRIVRHLCALRALGDDDTSTLIETSLGLGGASGVLAKRATLGEMSRLRNVDVPRTDSILSVSDLRTWVRRFGLPAILKLDGSWGGNDVVVVRHESEIRPAFWQMRFRQRVLRSLKHHVTRKDVEALGRLRSAISVQSFIPGKQANATVACWRGEVLAQVAVEVVQLANPFGAASVVHVVDGEAMAATARSICSHYMLSGLHGFDFIVDERSGATKLIEINPRATQIGHFNLGPGRDLAAALFEAVSGRSAARRPPIQSADISLFPGEWRRNSQSPYLTSTFHDVPYDDVDLALYYGFDLSSGPVTAAPAAPSPQGGGLKGVVSREVDCMTGLRFPSA